MVETYKASFNGLGVEFKGVYKAYNLTPEEIVSIRKHFCDQISDSKTSYTVSCVVENHLWLTLFIHELWEPIRFDIKKDYLKLTHSDEISKNDIERISASIEKLNISLYVSYNYYNNTWTIKDYDRFLEVLKSLL